MGKKKGKSDNQYLFIDFANLNLRQSKQISNLVDEVLKHCNAKGHAPRNINFPAIAPRSGVLGSAALKEVKSSLNTNIKIMKKLEKIDGHFYDDFVKGFLVCSKKNYFKLNKRERGKYRKRYIPEGGELYKEIYFPKVDEMTELQEKMEKICGNLSRADVSLMGYKLIDFLQFYCGIQYSQLKLKRLLREISNHRKLDYFSIKIIEKNYALLKTVLEFGENTYFKIRKESTTSYPLYRPRQELPFEVYLRFLKYMFNPIIFTSLANFLCTSGWKMLRQCPGVCEGKFFIKTGNMKHHSAECGKATKEKRDRESGMAKARQKKHRDKKKKEKERRKEEQLKVLRESARGIA